MEILRLVAGWEINEPGGNSLTLTIVKFIDNRCQIIVRLILLIFFTILNNRDKENANLDVPVSGLPNLGNTCYLNSVVQVLRNMAKSGKSSLHFPTPQGSFSITDLQTNSKCLVKLIAVLVHLATCK